MSKNYRLLWQALENISFGSLEITLADGQIKKFQAVKNTDEKCAKIKIKNDDLIDLLITGGGVAFGESYMNGWWETDDLPNLLTFITRNAHALEGFFHARKFRALLLFLGSFFTKNTKRGSKKNIKAHYDLGNDFYQLWLDETLTYSAALFDRPNLDLPSAQRRKYQNILDKLSGNSVLEIGCGWGGFAEMAAKENKQVTCLTISEKQKAFAEARMAKNNLQNLVKIKLQDYREENSTYDNIVSIEMFEAVGQEYWHEYFEVLRRNLRDKGRAVLQIITIDEKVFEDYINRVDFIQKHIFPGGVLPSKNKIRELAKKNGFELRSEISFGNDYARTLEIWLERFDQKYLEILALGFSDQFIRKWRFYLSYCIAGFLAKRTDVVQFELIKI